MKVVVPAPGPRQTELFLMMLLHPLFGELAVSGEDIRIWWKLVFSRQDVGKVRFQFLLFVPLHFLGGHLPCV